MVEASSTRAGLYAILAAAAIITAGCSTVATVPEEEDAQDAAALVEEVELDPAITKVDEADIGVSGPETPMSASSTLVMAGSSSTSSTRASSS